MEAVDKIQEAYKTNIHDDIVYAVHKYWPQVKEDFEKLEAENEKLKACLRGHKKPGHGPCCTCQRCGRHYDECRCDLDDFLDEKEMLEAENKELAKKLESALSGYSDPDFH